MDKIQKITLAQAAEMALLEGGVQAVRQLNKGIQNEENKQQVNPDGTSNLDKPITDELERIRAEQLVTESLGTFGIDRAAAENYMKVIAEKTGAPFTHQVQILQMIGQKAGEMGTTPQDIFPLVLAIYIRNKDVQLTQGILSILAKYESQAPGIGVLDVAKKTAMGQPTGHELMQIRIALMAAGGEFNSKGLTSTKDLEKAIYSIVAPQSESGAAIMKWQEQRLKTQSGIEDWLRSLGRFQANYSTQRLKKVEEAYEFLIKTFPNIATTAPMDWWMKVLNGVAAASTVKEYGMIAINPTIQGETPVQKIQQMSQMPLINRGANNQSKIITAQSAPQDLRSQDPVATTSAGQNQQSIPNSGEVDIATQVANQANNAQLPASVEPMLGQFLNSTQMGKELLVAIDVFERGQLILDTEMKTLQDIIAKSGATDYMADGRPNNAVFMTPEQFQQAATRVYNLATQQQTVLVKILNLFSSMVNQIENRPQLLSLIQKAISEWRARHAKVESNLITAFELQLVGPIEQSIAMLIPQKEYLQNGIQMAAMINNIGADQYVGPFSALCMQISNLREEASKRYMKVASNAKVLPQFKNYALQRARQQMQQALAVRNEGVMAVMKMSQGIFGGQSLLPTADTKAWVKLSSERFPDDDIEKLADAKLEEYWNELYEDSPGAEGYGTAIEHTVELHGVPTKEISQKSKMKRNQDC